MSLQILKLDDEEKHLQNFCIKMKTKYNLEKPMKKVDVFRLVKLLRPTMDDKVLNNARSNHSKLSKDNITYHLLEIIPKLFIAALHIDDDVVLDPHKTVREQKYGNIRQRHLDSYLDDYLDDISILEKQVEDYQENVVSMKDYEDLIISHQLDMKHLKEENEKQIDYLKSRIEFRELKEKSNEKRLEEKVKYLEKQITIISSIDS
jgi:hypothetical protein